MDKSNSEQPSEVTFAKGNTLDELKKSEIELIEYGWQSEGPVIQNQDGTYSRKMIKP
jgi:hypothetical protein